MAIYRGDGGAGDATTDITINAVTAKATEAATSATNAASSASSASSSATSASNSASTATTKASEASSSATAAASSASSASTSASTASTAATNAQTAQTAAETAETNAETAETNAASSASAASTSASNASTSATAASNSASAAATSETNASNSASAASTSASNASTSATNASNSASAASTSATNASNSASAASTSATNAASSASAAAASAVTAASFTPDQTGNSGKYLTTDGSVTSWGVVASGDVVDDTTPQLGGTLDLNSKSITGTGNINITGGMILDGAAGYGSIEIGGDSGAFIDLKSPNSDDYDGRLVTTGTGLSITSGSGGVTLAHQNSAKLSTTATGVDVTGTITTDGLTTSGDINFGDVNKAIFGADSDLQIYHTGGASVIRDSGTGSLYIDGSSEIFLRGTSGFTNMIKAIDGAEVELYHNNAPKLSTTATGIDVTGTVAATTYTGDGSNLTGISAGATGGGDDQVFYENDQTVDTDYTITTNKNAMTAGPITVSSGVSVTVPSGSTWTIV